MAKSPHTDGETASERIRRHVLQIVKDIPQGRFTTYGSIAAHLAINPRHVARCLSHLTEEESAILPWFRVVAAEGRLSQGMDESLREKQRKCLEKEGMKINPKGFIMNPDQHFHVVGRNRRIRPAVE